ncbi:MAG TPA: sigma-70 family RNA polymerase sigma factor [Candidatus Limiplasma merdipullorum]|jgi:RNA polymerase sigma-70 factor (ECF subfamily)|nr:sigma-70 family RNA polymerase sigma factor [Candidatus Limiplasma merdipullorum]
MSRIKGPDRAQDPNHELERLVLQYQQSLLRTCFLYLRDRTLAEDAVQETFLKAYRSLASFRGECSEKTWLMKIAMNTCCDLRRAHRLRSIDPRRIPELLPQAAEPFAPAEEELVTQVIQLPRKLREVILLYYYQDMTVTEIAVSLGISQSSVSGRLKRARGKLRTLLEGRDIC